MNSKFNTFENMEPALTAFLCDFTRPVNPIMIASFIQKTDASGSRYS
ncbi:hypothetical protein ATPR_2466 [Acetobacter tropicalis NBRC 101654]|uniref:Transposase n=1 Tax=Acetobacter tropicalis NBRC 101654 TaxID=749388 RepID=F7VGG6_9PROT|nr:hypothetical protein ATPR_2466 [Acetobacter tropicalis NBRC 101654]